MDGGQRQGLGMGLLLASSAAFSTAGFFTRLIPLDVWTMLFWRGIFGGGFIAAYVAITHRRHTWNAIRGIGATGLLIAALSTGSTICFINALRLTTVADANIIFATAPFVTAAIAWLWTGEREHWSTLMASVVALAGVTLMVDAALAAGHIAGDLLALAMTLGIAVMMVLIRIRRQTEMLPAVSLSGFLCSLAILPLAHPASPAPFELLYLVLFGVAQFGLGLMLLTIGTRFISATRSTLIGSLEAPLACFWVWLAFNEAPPVLTCLGGAVVIAAIVGSVLLHPVPPPTLRLRRVS